MRRPGRPVEKKNNDDNNSNKMSLLELQSNTAVVK